MGAWVDRVTCRCRKTELINLLKKLDAQICVMLESLLRCSAGELKQVALDKQELGLSKGVAISASVATRTMHAPFAQTHINSSDRSHPHWTKRKLQQSAAIAS